MGVKEWLLKKALQKGAVQLGLLVGSYAVATHVPLEGLSDEQLTAALFVVLQVLRNWLKVKVGVKFL